MPTFRLQFCMSISSLRHIASICLGFMMILSASLGCGQGIDMRTIDKAFQAGKPDEAIRLATELVATNPKASNLYLIRGMTYFRCGKIEESLKDFDKSIELDPVSAPHNWQRGISLYYAGRFDDGVKQFESHREVNPNDVENSIWHFLCKAKRDGMDAARKGLIPVRYDRRVPLMEVLKLFAGDMTPEQVLAVAENASGSRDKIEAKFYGYLYVGLYWDAMGDKEKGKLYLQKCLDQKVGGYMEDVARIHLELNK